MKTLNSISLGTIAAVLPITLLAAVGSISSAQTTVNPFARTTTATTAAAVPAPEPERGGYMKMLKDMGLTPAQMAQIKPMMKSQRTQIEAIKANTTLTEKQRRQQMRQVRQSALASIRQVLTPAQQQTLATDMAQEKAEREAARTGNQP